MQLFAYVSTGGDIFASLSRFRNMIGRKEDGLCLFADWMQGQANLLGNVHYGLSLTKGCGVENVAYAIPLAGKDWTLDDVAAGRVDAAYAAVFEAIKAAYPPALIRLGWEEDGS